MQIVGNAKTFNMMGQFFDIDLTDRKVVVEMCIRDRDNNVPPHMTISAIEARSENALLGAMDKDVYKRQS